MAKTDLIVQEKTVQSLEPIGDETIDAMRQKAQMMLDAKLMPAALNSVEKILTVALTGKELGIPFNMAVHNVYVINGRPSLSVHAIGSLLKKANVYYKCTEDYMRVDVQSGGEVTTETKETTVRTTFLFKTIWNKTVQEQSFSMTMREAALAGWADKEVWKSMPN